MAKKKAAKKTSSGGGKKRRSGGGKKRRSGGGRRGGAGLSGKDIWVALGAATAVSYLQGAAIEARAKDDKAEPLITKIPMISSIGRTATMAIIAYIGWRFGGIAFLKPVALGLGILAVAQLARRGFKLYDEKDPKDKDALMLSGGSDEWTVASPQISLSGDLTIDGEDSDALSGFLDQLRAAA